MSKLKAFQVMWLSMSSPTPNPVGVGGWGEWVEWVGQGGVIDTLLPAWGGAFDWSFHVQFFFLPRGRYRWSPGGNK